MTCRSAPTAGRVAALLGCLLVLPLARPAAAAEPTEQLRGHVERVLEILKDPSLRAEDRAAARRAAIRRVADEIFDFEETAKRALGPHWRERSPAERREFVQLFADLLERAYIARIERYQGEKIAWLGDTVEDEQAVVRTRIVTQQGTEVPVDYRLLRRDGRWLIYDVVIEGVSLVANYRTQFNRIIRTSSYQELVTRMKTRMDELSRTAPGARG